jgi:CheY-like chemotaxis protein
MLAFARKKIVKPEVLNLNRVIARMEPLLRRLIGEDLDLVLAPGVSLGLVKVDIASMEQVIMNLAVNARDAMPTGGRLTIETLNVSLDREYAAKHVETKAGAYVMLAVSDTGTGIPEDIRGKIFEPFFTTKPAGQGTGLGLAMCQGIVKQADGHIEVYSELDKGSTFKVYLPVVMEGAESLRKSPSTAPMRGGTETVIFVEDEPLVRDFAQQALSGLGYTVIDAANGFMALERAASHLGAVHILVTDVVMPKMSGTELAKKMVEKYPGIKVLYSSGYTENAIVHHGILGEDINFIQKPYTPSALAEAIRKVLDQDEPHSK